ncbi:hypothetical protein [Pseudonocardia sp.]
MGSAQRALPPVRAERVHHPAVGDLHLTFESLDLPADPRLRQLVVVHAGR